MGRPRKPLACSRCNRTPDEVRINSNRFCVDCMRTYNHERYLERKKLYGVSDAQRRLTEQHVQVIFEDPNAPVELVGSEDEI